MSTGSVGTIRGNTGRGRPARHWLARPISARQAALAGLMAVALGGAVAAAASVGGGRAALALALVFAPLVALIVGDLRRLLLGVVLLDIPLSYDVNFSYRLDAGQLGAIGGWNVSLTTLGLIGLYAIWLGASLSGVGLRPRMRLGPALPLMLYLGVMAVTAVFARDVQLSLFELFLHLQMFLLYVYVVSHVRTREDVVFVAAMLAAGLFIEALIVIGVSLTGLHINAAGLTTAVDADASRVGQPVRPVGTLGSPNSLAGFLGTVLVPVLALAFARVGGRTRLFAFAAYGLGTAALILTLSRGGYIAFALSTLVLLVLAGRRGWLSAPRALAMLLVIALVAGVFHEPLLGRLFGDDRGAAESRVPLMHLAFDVIQDNPVVGVGPNNFAAAIPDYAGPEYGRAWLYTVHNAYLQIWAEIGLIGLLAFLLFFVVSLRRAWLVAVRADPVLSPLALGIVAGMLGRASHMFVDLFSGRSQVQLLWVLAALAAAMLVIGPAGGEQGAPGTDRHAPGRATNLVDHENGARPDRSRPAVVPRRAGQR